MQEFGRVQEEMSSIQQNLLSLLTVLQSESAAEHLQEVKVELVSQKARLQDVMERVMKRWRSVPSEIHILQNELNASLQEAKDKLAMVMEKSGPLRKMGEQIGEVTVGLLCVQGLLKQTSPNFSEAEQTQKTQWEKAHRSVTESREQCASLTELLKKFQSCRNSLGGILQRAEQTIGDQASYMGKDNLQLLISKVISIKSDLSGLGDGVEEFRSVCRQLQSLVRRVLDCTDAPFESEADTLMDRWLDVTEKTDCYLDNLQAGFSLWEKLLLLAGEVEGWSSQKLITLAQSNPFKTEVDVFDMQNDLKVQEENIHFHRRSSEIQELLQSQEFPLELQVIESQLRKKMAEVKELFFETRDVFRQLETAKMQVATEIADHLSSIQTITNNLNTLNTCESPHALNTIQRLAEQLEVKAEQADALLQQMDLLASIAGLENLQTLAEAGAHLQESIGIAKELVIKKGEQAMNPNRPESSQPVEESKQIKAHIKKAEDTELQTVWHDKADEQSLRGKAKDAAPEQKYFKEDMLLSENKNRRDLN
ncbi:nesprin-2-like [Danio aesculapii]|uniref:nesprin-2-like n=1 Tax=Danio aesculapii TaxID=1142201 RepID=UPI0024BFE613|nr:nesprin-2-like [Danio aesculapii]